MRWKTILPTVKLSLTTVLPGLAPVFLSLVSLEPVVIDGSNQAGFSPLDTANKAWIGLASGFLAGPLLDKALFHLTEVKWKVPNGITGDQKKVLQDAAKHLYDIVDSSLATVTALAGTNAILKLDSGRGPLIATTIGSVASVAIAIGANLKLVHDADEGEDFAMNLRAGDRAAGKMQLNQLTTQIRWRAPFAVSGIVGVAGAATAAGLAFANFEGDASDKSGWFLQSYVPSLATLYMLAAALIQLSIQLHQMPEKLILVKSDHTRRNPQAVELRPIRNPSGV